MSRNDEMMKEMMKEICHRTIGQKRVEYEEEKVGTVVEDLIISSVLKPDGQSEERAELRVSINGQEVRVVDLKTNQVIKSDPRFEPYTFLRMGQHTIAELDDPYGLHLR